MAASVVIAAMRASTGDHRCTEQQDADDGGQFPVSSVRDSMLVAPCS
jgi:hypothetical protein